jgi:hypothetical protein
MTDLDILLAVNNPKTSRHIQHRGNTPHPSWNTNYHGRGKSSKDARSEKIGEKYIYKYLIISIL